MQSNKSKGIILHEVYKDGRKFRMGIPFKKSMWFMEIYLPIYKLSLEIVVIKVVKSFSFQQFSLHFQ